MRERRPSGERVVAAGLLLALAGCSVIYDPGGFSTQDAAPPDGPVVVNDADIAGLDVTGFAPVVLAEGSGCIHDGTACSTTARAIPVVIQGVNIEGSLATVTVNGAGYDNEVVPATFSADHTMLAIAVRIPPDLGLAAGDSAMLTVTVAQGEFSDSVDVPVAGLADFVASVDAASGTVDVSTSPLDARYATVHIDAAIRFIGDTPVKLAAMSSFTVGATLDVSGFDGGNGATAGAAGPGGCAGGVEEGPGGCDASGGQAGGTASGGGGGGNRTAGSGGVGTDPGEPGALASNETIAPLGAPAGARGNGGGGGGRTSLGVVGGAGGGGGGTLLITSEGSLLMTNASGLVAGGGNGGPGEGSCLVLDEHGGGGGAGSGGVVLIRARTTFSDEGGQVTVNPGTAGNGGCNAGGAGSAGRVRIDLPSADGDPTLVGTTAFRGIVIDPALSPVVTEGSVAVSFFGGPNADYRIQVEGQGKQTATTLSNRTGSATVTLQPGSNRLCVLVNDAVNLSSDEGAQCVTIAYMPQ